MRLFRSRRRLLVLLLALAGMGLGVWRWRTRPENPTLAGVPLAERAKGLKDPDEAVRKRTLRTFAAFGPKSRGAMPQVIDALDEGKTTDDAVLALGRMREEALPTLTEWLTARQPSSNTPWRSGDRWAQRQLYAARALGFAGPCAVPLLLRYRDSQDERVRGAIRASIRQLTIEHPETLPDFAPLEEAHDTIAQYAARIRRVGWRDTIELNPQALDILKGLLDSPKPEVQLFATRALFWTFAYDSVAREKHLIDPRLIPGLCRRWAGGWDDVALNELLALLHRHGHSVIPALMAEVRAILDGKRDPREEMQREELSVALSRLSSLGHAADAVVPELRALARQHPKKLESAYFQFLADYEKRLVPRELLPALGGGPLTVGLPSSVLPELVAAARGLEFWSNPAARSLRAAPRRAAPLIARALAAGNTARRVELLRMLAHDWNCLDDRSLVIPDELVQAVADCLSDTQTRSLAIRVLIYFGPYAASAVPDLLDNLDASNLTATLTAINRIPVDTILYRYLADRIPAADRYATVRTRFAAHPHREQLWELLHQIRTDDHDRSTESVAEIVRFILVPSAERFANKRDGRWEFVHFAEYLAASDPVYFAILFDAGVLDAGNLFDRDLPGGLNPVFRQLQGTTAPLPVVLRSIRRTNGYGVGALPRLWPTETPKEIAETLFDLLAKENPDDRNFDILNALLELSPVPGKWTVPDAARAGNGRQRRLAAAVALRWNPDDAGAFADVVRGYPGFSVLVPDAPYDASVVRVLVPLAATRPRARVAVADLLAKMPDPSRATDFEVLYQALRAAGADGAAAVVDAYLRTDSPVLLDALHRLARENAVNLPEVFTRAWDAKKASQVLFGLMTDETAHFGVRLLNANPGLLWEEPLILRNPNTGPVTLNHATQIPDAYPAKIRFAALEPLLRQWLAGKDERKRSNACNILCLTHPTDPDVWAGAEVEYEKHPHSAVDDPIRQLFLSDPVRAYPVVLRVMGRLDQNERNHRTMLVHVLRALPKQTVLDRLTDAAPYVRRCALRSLEARARESKTPTEWLTARQAASLGPLLGDPDEAVRVAAWRAVSVGLFIGDWRQATPPWHPLTVLEPRHRPLWIEQTAVFLRTPPRFDHPFDHAYLAGELKKIADRAELLRRIDTDAGARAEFFSRYSGDEPDDLLRAVALRAPPELVARLGHLKSVPSVGLINLLGDLGPPARDAVPLLLTFAADPQPKLRHIAREALRKIAPDVFAELD